LPISCVPNLTGLVAKSLVDADVSGAKLRFRLLYTTCAYEIEKVDARGLGTAMLNASVVVLSALKAKRGRLLGLAKHIVGEQISAQHYSVQVLTHHASADHQQGPARFQVDSRLSERTFLAPTLAARWPLRGHDYITPNTVQLNPPFGGWVEYGAWRRLCARSPLIMPYSISRRRRPTLVRASASRAKHHQRRCPMSSSDSAFDRRKFLRGSLGALPVALGVALVAGPPAAAAAAQSYQPKFFTAPALRQMPNFELRAHAHLKRPGALVPG
jgi:hypothetical protein